MYGLYLRLNVLAWDFAFASDHLFVAYRTVTIFMPSEHLFRLNFFAGQQKSALIPFRSLSVL